MGDGRWNPNRWQSPLPLQVVPGVHTYMYGVLTRLWMLGSIQLTSYLSTEYTGLSGVSHSPFEHLSRYLARSCCWPLPWCIVHTRRIRLSIDCFGGPSSQYPPTILAKAKKRSDKKPWPNGTPAPEPMSRAGEEASRNISCQQQVPSS